MKFVGLVTSIVALSSVAGAARCSDLTGPTSVGDDLALGRAGGASVGEVVVTPASMTVAPGATVTLVAVVRDTEGKVVPGRGVTWTSSDQTVASISTSGVVIGSKEGEVTITAISSGKATSVAVTVGTGTPAPTPSGVVLLDGFETGTRAGDLKRFK